MMGSTHADNDGRRRAGQAVEVRYPLEDPQLQMPAGIHDAEALAPVKAVRAAWAGPGGEITEQRGQFEWLVTAYGRRPATLEDEPAPDDDARFPVCSRDSPESREPARTAEVPDPEAGQ